MIPQANITAWRSVAPWPDDAQVEQDLVLTRAVVELFTDQGLASTFALRGGTALNKLYVQPPSRYSEDIDLVQTRAAPAGVMLDAIRSKLDPWLGSPRRSRAEGGVTLLYSFESEIPPVRPLRLKIEINTREHFTVLAFIRRTIAVQNPWFTGTVDVTTYELDELMGTKLRALYQRRKGRDLFDLWLCLEKKLIDPERVVTCFGKYMAHGNQQISRAQFERNLHEKQEHAAFQGDIQPLLATGVAYDAETAMLVVRKELIERLTGEPWRKPAEPRTDSDPRRTHQG